MQLRSGKKTKRSKITLQIIEIQPLKLETYVHPYNTRSTTKKALKNRHFSETDENNKIQ